MIRELVELSERIRSQSPSGFSHDALKTELIGIDCVIREDGEFISFQCFEKIPTLTEALSSKKGKARLLVDKCEEVLGLEAKEQSKEGWQRKHELFREKLERFRAVSRLSPIFRFYEKSEIGIEKARGVFFAQVPEKKRVENIGFRVLNDDRRLHEDASVYEAIVKEYESAAASSAGKKRCSVCGSTQYPVGDIPHGMIKKVPAGQSSGCALVSYNCSAFESYGLTGNNNSSICAHCAKAYVEALNWLMGSGQEVPSTEGKKSRFVFTNRKKISSDTAFVYWLRDAEPAGFLDLLESPSEDSVAKLFDSPFTGTGRSTFKDGIFYGASLSGSAARIFIRDWMQESLAEVQRSLRLWFEDITVVGQRKGDPSPKPLYFGIPALAYACRRKDDNADELQGRVGTALWRSAIRGVAIPLWVLAAVLNRLRAEQGRVTPERASLIKLFLLRNGAIKRGGYNMDKLDPGNSETPYLCGRLFAVLERIQYHAQGDVNAGIGERFFTAASSTPSTAFGRLLRLTKQHLSKIKGEKPGLAVHLDREIQAILAGVSTFPNTFQLEEQGLFALGYYHQKNFRNEANNNNN